MLLQANSGTHTGLHVGPSVAAEQFQLKLECVEKFLVKIRSVDTTFYMMSDGRADIAKPTRAFFNFIANATKNFQLFRVRSFDIVFFHYAHNVLCSDN